MSGIRECNVEECALNVEGLCSINDQDCKAEESDLITIEGYIKKYETNEE